MTKRMSSHEQLGKDQRTAKAKANNQPTMNRQHMPSTFTPLTVAVALFCLGGCAPKQDASGGDARTPNGVNSANSSRGDGATGEPSAEQVFEKRIMPIFQSPNPSSCTQCHLANVDLKNYILPSHEKTFLSLRDQGLINVEKPEESKILKLINMREEVANGANLIHEKVRQAEVEAFAEWIKASCRDPKLRAAPKLQPLDLAQPPRPPEVIRHARKDRLLESFEQNVWSMRFRCMGCHSEGTEESAKHRKEYGERVVWMKPTAIETMTYLLSKPRLIDTQSPEKSLLLRKPLNEVKHGGGKKFLPGDLGYKGFRAWIEDYAAVVGDTYARAADLPKEPGNLAQFGSDIWLKLPDTPPEWGDKLLQVTVYAWDEQEKAWQDEPIATSDRGVWGKGRLWQHNLTLMAARGSKRAEAWKRGEAALPPGRYLVKVYVDRVDRLGKDWRATLGAKELVGQAEITSRWRAGYGNMTVLDSSRLRQ